MVHDNQLGKAREYSPILTFSSLVGLTLTDVRTRRSAKRVLLRLPRKVSSPYFAGDHSTCHRNLVRVGFNTHLPGRIHYFTFDLAFILIYRVASFL